MFEMFLGGNNEEGSCIYILSEVEKGEKENV